MQDTVLKKRKSHSVKPRVIGSKSSDDYTFGEPQYWMAEDIAVKYPDYKTKHWTYDEFSQADFGDNVFVEIINGELYFMPSPGIIHQTISMELAYQLYGFCRGTSIKVLTSPIDVRLFPKADKTDDTVVMPDIAVMCDPAKFSEISHDGAPDMVIEILSPSNKKHDQVVKYELYKKSCVKEYWIVDPKNETVSVFILDNGEYVKTLYKKTDTIKVKVLNDVCPNEANGESGLSIHLADVFK
ncbi:MAG: type II toxin-antitoxin system prevent-host-death family antitoxin [Termitinemataceae bacterium]|nr:MAG: type II toxin-antitoxin system prevent-host-death family antitoxin [Termitinemataceae bacterium]